MSIAGAHQDGLLSIVAAYRRSRQHTAGQDNIFTMGAVAVLSHRTSGTGAETGLHLVVTGQVIQPYWLGTILHPNMKDNDIKSILVTIYHYYSNK